MSLARPKVKAPTPLAPEPTQGADELKLGFRDTGRGKGAAGRLKLRKK